MIDGKKSLRTACLNNTGVVDDEFGTGYHVGQSFRTSDISVAKLDLKSVQQRQVGRPAYPGHDTEAFLIELAAQT